MTLSLDIAEHVADTTFAQLPPKTVEVTKLSLLDAIGVTLGASGIGEGCDAFAQLALDSSSKEEATILGYGKRTSASLAAFANGAMAHALDFEDAHDGAPVHPNAQTIPAALAVAECLPNVSGEELLTAIAVGSDLVCRLGLSLTKSLDEFGWYPPPILGAFGATAAAAKLLRLDSRQTLDAFSLTLCQAACSAELKYNADSVVRSVRDSFAAQTGVVSAQLAQKGVRGFAEPFEGKAGLFNNFARGHYDRKVLLEDLGQHFENENISFKPWPACRGTHAFIDAALSIMNREGLQASDIAQGRMLGHAVQRMLYEPLQQKRSPSTAIDAKFSLPFTVAAVLVHGEITLDSFALDNLKDQTVLELAKRLTFEVDASGTENATRGTLELIARDGKTFSLHVENPLGHSSRPMTIDALRAKFMRCAGLARIPLSNPASAADSVLSLEKTHDLQRNLFSQLR